MSQPPILRRGPSNLTVHPTSVSFATPEGARTREPPVLQHRMRDVSSTMKMVENQEQQQQQQQQQHEGDSSQFHSRSVLSSAAVSAAAQQQQQQQQGSASSASSSSSTSSSISRDGTAAFPADERQQHTKNPTSGSEDGGENYRTPPPPQQAAESLMRSSRTGGFSTSSTSQHRNQQNNQSQRSNNNNQQQQAHGRTRSSSPIDASFEGNESMNNNNKKQSTTTPSDLDRLSPVIDTSTTAMNVTPQRGVQQQQQQQQNQHQMQVHNQQQQQSQSQYQHQQNQLQQQSHQHRTSIISSSSEAEQIQVMQQQFYQMQSERDLYRNECESLQRRCADISNLHEQSKLDLAKVTHQLNTFKEKVNAAVSADMLARAQEQLWHNRIGIDDSDAQMKALENELQMVRKQNKGYLDNVSAPRTGADPYVAMHTKHEAELKKLTASMNRDLAITSAMRRDMKAVMEIYFYGMKHLAYAVEAAADGARAPPPLLKEFAEVLKNTEKMALAEAACSDGGFFDAQLDSMRGDEIYSGVTATAHNSYTAINQYNNNQQQQQQQQQNRNTNRQHQIGAAGSTPPPFRNVANPSCSMSFAPPKLSSGRPSTQRLEGPAPLGCPSTISSYVNDLNGTIEKCFVKISANVMAVGQDAAGIRDVLGNAAGAVINEIRYHLLPQNLFTRDFVDQIHLTAEKALQEVEAVCEDEFGGEPAQESLIPDVVEKIKRQREMESQMPPLYVGGGGGGSVHGGAGGSSVLGGLGGGGGGSGSSIKESATGTGIGGLTETASRSGTGILMGRSSSVAATPPSVTSMSESYLQQQRDQQAQSKQQHQQQQQTAGTPLPQQPIQLPVPTPQVQQNQQQQQQLPPVHHVGSVLSANSTLLDVSQSSTALPSANASVNFAHLQQQHQQQLQNQQQNQNVNPSSTVNNNSNIAANQSQMNASSGMIDTPNHPLSNNNNNNNNNNNLPQQQQQQASQESSPLSAADFQFHQQQQQQQQQQQIQLQQLQQQQFLEHQHLEEMVRAQVHHELQEQKKKRNKKPTPEHLMHITSSLTNMSMLLHNNLNATEENKTAIEEILTKFYTQVEGMVHVPKKLGKSGGGGGGPTFKMDTSSIAGKSSHYAQSARGGADSCVSSSSASEC